MEPTRLAEFYFVNDIQSVQDFKPNAFYYVPIGNNLFRQYVTDKDGNLREQEGEASIVAWDEIQNKPSEFPPSAHTHTANQITDFEDAVKDVKVESLFKNVKNASGVTLNIGTPVKIIGATGENPNVTISNATNQGVPDRHNGDKNIVFGIVSETINNNAVGSVLIKGVLKNVDTTSYDVGDFLYVASSGNVLTATPPVSPAYQICIGLVTKKAADGEICVNVQEPIHINDVTGFNLNRATLADKQAIIFNGTEFVNRLLDADDVFETDDKEWLTESPIVTGATIKFDKIKGYSHGQETAYLNTTVYTFDFTDAKVGSVVTIFSNAAIEPTFSNGDVVATGGSFSSSGTIIFLNFVGNNKVLKAYSNPASSTTFGTANQIPFTNATEDDFGYNAFRYVGGKLVINASSGEDAHLFVKTDDALNTSKAVHVVNDSAQTLHQLNNSGVFEHNIRRSAPGSQAASQGSISVFNQSDILTTVFEVVNSSAIAPGIRIPKLLVSSIHTQGGILTSGTTNANISIFGGSISNGQAGFGTFSNIGDRTTANTTAILNRVIKRYNNATDYANNKVFIGQQVEMNGTNGVAYGPNTSQITDVGYRTRGAFADGPTPGGLQWRHWGYDWTIPTKNSGTVTNEATDIIAFKITDLGIPNQVTNFTAFENLFENGQFVNRLKNYADHSAADSDTTLRQYAFYKLTDDRTVYIKP